MRNENEITNLQSVPNTELEEIEGIDSEGSSWGDYPIDSVLIRTESRTIHDVVRRIDQKVYIMDPDFQRDFIWAEDKQSRLIESVIMRIPLPVFYLAEENSGKMVVVDGLQRLTTFHRFIKDKLRLKLPDREELNGKRFSDLESKLQNRIEDCNLTLYTIDSKVPERARLDIFERVNGGVPLTRQQMRNCLFMGKATRFLKEESRTDIFLQATDGRLRKDTMRDREFVNRFCAFQLLGVDTYRGDMDDFLAQCLRKMNRMSESELSCLSVEFRRGLANNFKLFGPNAFRKLPKSNGRRSVLNASLWDVMSTGLSRYSPNQIEDFRESLYESVCELLSDEEFQRAITYATNDTRRVRKRFSEVHRVFEEILGAQQD